MFKKIIGPVLIFFIVVIITLSFLIIIKTSQRLGVNPKYLVSEIVSSLKHPKYEGKMNFMVLGLDYRDDSLEKTQTTDTIIFVSYDTSIQKLSLISLPRDLWDYSLNHKINDIYPESLLSKDKFSYIKGNYQRIVGQKIDNVVIINTAALSDLVSIIGGVDVNLKQGFVDNEYPNPEYIKDPKNPKIPMYITVEFKAGLVHLDSKNIIPFVRSRKSLTGGSDLGRILRQQLVIDAIISKLKETKNITPKLIFDLYRFWHTDINTDFKDGDLGALVYQQQKKLLNLTLNKVEIPVGTNPNDEQIYHLCSFQNLQWLFVAIDKDFKSLHKYIQESL